ncbi:MAG TPA: hypothetical protein VIR45_11995 [Kiloniellaceae bacterium]
MAALAGGDKSIRVPHASRADEVGAIGDRRRGQRHQGNRQYDRRDQ